MLPLHQIKKDQQILGLVPDQCVRIVSVDRLNDETLSVVYKDAQGQLGERMLFGADAEQLALHSPEVQLAFDAPGKLYKLVLEALRIQRAAQFDPMMALHTSTVEPLPHQISAVYEAMLPRQPLRFVLADDPGAGKTIMAGLLIKELRLRADALRVLVVAPASLTEQWQEELREKLDLPFELLPSTPALAPKDNPFAQRSLLIGRLDQLARNPQQQAWLRAVEWDLVIFDEAHKLSLKAYPQRVHKTKRFQLGELLAARTRHLLLITATPMNGSSADFQAWLSLLDEDRFYGPGRRHDAPHDLSDVMRRLPKEELLRFDGTPLFPERRAYTARYQLSAPEAALYEGVTNYVRHEMSRLEARGEHRRGPVGFALTLLQRRLASSPAAIYHSLRRRRERMWQKFEALSQGYALRASDTLPDWADGEEDWEELWSASEWEARGQVLLERASGAHSLAELQQEIHSLQQLEQRAYALLASGRDKKWEELSRLLQQSPEMYGAHGRRRKLLLFTEHRDTLEDLYLRIVPALAQPEEVLTLHGSLSREQRRQRQEAFRQDPKVHLLIATDAAGEGVNLHSASLLVNYDLPWNPNRLEQRFGRIHRIGQTHTCHMWHMVASDTREGQVFELLFDKLERERQTLGGKVFDVLGEAFENTSLQDLLIDAIRQQSSEEMQTQLSRQLAQVLDQGRLRQLLQRHALVEQAMDFATLSSIRNDLEKAEAKRLQPFFVRAYCLEALRHLGAEWGEPEPGRYQIPVPAALLHRRHATLSEQPLLSAYERVCFAPALKRWPKAPEADLLHPEHPLMLALNAEILHRHRDALTRGALLVDPHCDETALSVLCMLEHSLCEADSQRVVSRRIDFLRVRADGSVENAGAAPHLDLRPASDREQALLQAAREAPWLQQEATAPALAHAATQLLPSHCREAQQQRDRQWQHIRDAVEQRLGREMHYWRDQYQILQMQIEAGEACSMQPETALKRLQQLQQRLAHRRRQLERQQRLIPQPPRLLSAALLAPQGLLMHLRQEEGYFISTAAKARIENLAMRAVIEYERAQGHQVLDVSAQKCGWDITASVPTTLGALPQERHIEVKGRAASQTTLTVTRNEILYALNQSDKYWLAIVKVDGDRVDGPYYVQRPFEVDPDFSVASVNFDLRALLKRAQPPRACPKPHKAT